MTHYQPPELRARYPGFVSFCNRQPIHYPFRWMGDALAQTVLDPMVREVSPDGEPSDSRQCRIIVTRGGKRYPVLLDGDEGLGRAAGALKITRSETRQEPKWTLARMIWSHRRDPICASSELALLAEIERLGADATLGRLSTASAVPNAVDHVLAMISRGLVGATWLCGIVPEMEIWRRRLPRNENLASKEFGPTKADRITSRFDERNSPKSCDFAAQRPAKVDAKERNKP